MATSTTVRRWRQNGTPRHHILDPSTGVPAQEHWRTVSVVAGSCVDANTAATAAIVWGERDPFLPVSLGKRLHSTIPNSTLEIVPGARHFVPVESAHQLAASIAQLLQR